MYNKLHKKICTYLLKKSISFSPMSFVDGYAYYSEQRLLIDDKLEFQTQLPRRPAAEVHAGQENFKVVHNGTVFGVDVHFQLDVGVIFIDLQKCLLHGIVDPIVNIEGGLILIADTTAAHIGFICQNQRR